MSVMRDFSATHNIGNIEVYPTTGHGLYVLVQSLQDNEPIDWLCDLAVLYVTVDPTCDLYDAILAVMDQITADHQHNIRGAPYRQYVDCDREFTEKHPELCCHPDPQEGPWYGDHWMPFTRDAMPHLKVMPWNLEKDRANPEHIILQGQVTAGTAAPVFTYDFPVISAYNNSRRYYELTRGKCAWEVAYKDVYPDPTYTHDIMFVYRDFVPLNYDPAFPVCGIRLWIPSEREIIAESVGRPQTPICVAVDLTPDTGLDRMSVLAVVLEHLTEAWYHDMCPSETVTFDDYIQCSPDYVDQPPCACRNYAEKKGTYALGGGWYQLDSYPLQYMSIVTDPSVLSELLPPTETCRKATVTKNLVFKIVPSPMNV
jgi:hypothetical protein